MQIWGGSQLLAKCDGDSWWRAPASVASWSGLSLSPFTSNQHPIQAVFPNVLLNRGAHLAITLTSNTSQCCGRSEAFIPCGGGNDFVGRAMAMLIGVQLVITLSVHRSLGIRAGQLCFLKTSSCMGWSGRAGWHSASRLQTTITDPHTGQSPRSVDEAWGTDWWVRRTTMPASRRFRHTHTSSGSFVTSSCTRRAPPLPMSTSMSTPIMTWPWPGTMTSPSRSFWSSYPRREDWTTPSLFFSRTTGSREEKAHSPWLSRWRWEEMWQCDNCCQIISGQSGE